MREIFGVVVVIYTCMKNKYFVFALVLVVFIASFFVFYGASGAHFLGIALTSKNAGVLVKNNIDITSKTQLEKKILPVISTKSNGVEAAYLDKYSNLVKIKSALEGIKIWDNSAAKYTMNGKDLVKVILQNGYDGFSSNDDKDAFFKKQFEPYGLQYSVQNDFIRQVVHSLWLEGTKTMPWSIADYTENQALLLYPSFFKIDTITASNIFPIPLYPKDSWSKVSDYGIVTKDFWNDSIAKTFILSHKLTSGANDQTQTVLKLVSWMEKNFMHANWKYGWDVYKNDGTSGVFYGSTVLPLPKNLSRYFDERVGGCHEPSALMQGMLVSINIPAIDFRAAGHGVVYLPTLDKYIHGDHIADFALVPPESLLLTNEEMSALVKDPNVDYDGLIRKKFPSNFYVTNIEDDRDGNRMYLWTDSFASKIPAADWKTMVDQASLEYTLNYYQQPNHLIISSFKKIQTLEELSKK